LLKSSAGKEERRGGRDGREIGGQGQKPGLAWQMRRSGPSGSEMRDREAEVGGGGDEDGGVKDGDDGFGGGRGKAGVGRGGVSEEGGSTVGPPRKYLAIMFGIDEVESEKRRVVAKEFVNRY
jgi:hypothetical protein